jgi:hypothetical protein
VSGSRARSFITTVSPPQPEIAATMTTAIVTAKKTGKKRLPETFIYL